MESVNIIAIYGMFFGMIGTTLGGMIGALISVKSKKFLSFVLEFAAGLMTAVITLDLIPESLEMVNISWCIVGIFIGVVGLFLCEKIVNKLSDSKFNNIMISTGIMICIGLAIHNFPEGLAIGSGFEVNNKLGISLAIAIALHDVPEGMSIALPLKNGGYSKFKCVLLTAISGVTTGIGAYFGAILGSINEKIIGVSLAFAAGAMLYIVSCDLIPESNSIYRGKIGSLGNIIGMVLGLFTKLI